MPSAAKKERTRHDPDLFRIQCRRVENLAKWYELGIRPSLSSDSLVNAAAHESKDDDLFDAEVDDLPSLLRRSLIAQDEMNANLPPHPQGDYEDALLVRSSTIEGAGNGLFTSVYLGKGTVVCHYSGTRHDYHSQKKIVDRQYLLKLQNGYPKNSRRNDGFIDAGPCLDVKARFINDPGNDDKINVKFEHIREPGTWFCPVVAQRDIDAGEELFISYGPRYWNESRMIGG
eukprot:CAMPEP_0172495340 /NCGR_PEP_ID=MMETSP1066-20121228/67930_1 /TAXON_ID=671091 /ORGANISM="Coscinodiscus wailesii, Strain CCMP2513" /LENGTH=229 /DNA_ID=CAMNT_0013266927 /DNA_START=29 /DNA_END=718 /DNA_ORIENTATION=+